MTKQIVKLLATFILAFGAVSLIPTQIITMDRYVLDILFLIVVATVIIINFKKNLIPIAQKTQKYRFGLIFISLATHLLISYFIIKFLPQPSWPFKNSGASPLLMNNFFIWVKPFDILIQQLLIILLVQKMTEYKMTYQKITTLFVICFGAIHILQILKTDLVVGTTFALIAIILSVVFPSLILKVKDGYLYNYMIHLGIYDVMAVLARTIF